MTEFLLGAAIITLIYQGVKLSKVSKQVEALEANETKIEDTVYKMDELINRRIDQEIDRNDILHVDVIKYVNQVVQEKKNKKSLLKG